MRRFDMKVYVIIYDWSISNADSSGIEVEVFGTYKKAYDRFNEIIANEKNPNMSWVGIDAVDENGDIKEDYDFDEHIESDGTQEFDCWWNITDKNDWYRHVFLDLRVMEVK